MLSIAVATGHAVETLRPAAPARVVAAEAGAGVAMPGLAGITPISATQESDDPCAPRLDLAAEPGAMIRVALAAPCMVGERVLFRHSGLSFTDRVGVDGTVSLRLPALEEQALVAVYFEGSGVALQSVVVPDAASHPRFAFQVAHPVQFDLRVETEGRVHSGRASEMAGGPIVSLGTTAVSQPMLAQVYSFPGPDLSAVDLTVELRITPETCGRSFTAETLISESGAVRAQPWPITLPLCGTPGDIQVLKNLVVAPTLAIPG